MAIGNFSTSPGVRGGDSNQKRELEDGTQILIEGRPKLLDHVAICDLGVWDKGGPPAGVDRGNSEVSMSEEEMAADKAKKDASGEDKEREAAADKARKDAEGDKLDKVLAHLDGMSKRLDAVCERQDAADKARKDAEEEERRKKATPEEMAADKAKKDAEEAEEKKKETEKADKARRDAEEEKEKARADADAGIQRRIDELERKLPRAHTDEDRAKFADAQARADSVALAWGKQAPPPMSGEALINYRVRLADQFKEHAKDWAEVDLIGLPERVLDTAERVIYADAMQAALHPVEVGEAMVLRPIQKRDAAGRTITEFVGNPATWMDAYKMPRRRVRAWNTKTENE